ncbi:MAG: DUF2007 domain-containing protein [Bacteroidales bacterium]|nr:DUF2007 domain-containing protein [Bacteroidales bacterium]
MNEKERTCVLGEYDSLGEAEIIKGLLEANGIDCFISDRGANGLWPIGTSGIISVRLHVMEKDLEKAQAVMDGAETVQD